MIITRVFFIFVYKNYNYINNIIIIAVVDFFQGLILQFHPKFCEPSCNLVQPCQTLPAGDLNVVLIPSMSAQIIVETVRYIIYCNSPHHCPATLKVVG